MEVYIVFGKRRNPLLILSSLIRWINKTPYSHCGVLVGGVVYESTMPKSKTTNYTEWLKHYKLVDIVEVNIEEDPIPFLNTIIGVNYSYRQLILIGLSTVFYPIFKYFKPDTINGMKALICAEFAAIFLERFTTYRFGKNNDFISLSDVNEAARSLNLK